MATHSGVLAWRIPGMAEPGGLPSMGSHRVGHDWNDLAAAAAAGHFLESRQEKNEREEQLDKTHTNSQHFSLDEILDTDTSTSLTKASCTAKLNINWVKSIFLHRKDEEMFESNNTVSQKMNRLSFIWPLESADCNLLSPLKEINPEYSLEGLMLKLKLQYLTTWCQELTR